MATTAVATAAPTGGAITGRFSYPSDFIPPVTVFAISVSDASVFFSVDFPGAGNPPRPTLPPGASQATYTITGIAPGTYYVLGYRNDGQPLGPAAYTQQTVQCIKPMTSTPPPGCAVDHPALVPVAVVAGRTASGIDLLVWGGATSGWPARPSSCTSPSATTRQVLERLFALSASGDAAAVSDCYAKSYRDMNDTNPKFSDSAAIWSREGPATNVVIALLDVVNGCDRFRVTAQMPSGSAWMTGQGGGSQFFTVGPDAGGPRIYEAGTALVNGSIATTHCP